MMLSAKQGGIKYHFLSIWYDSTWDWTPVSRTIGGQEMDTANIFRTPNDWVYIQQTTHTF